MFDMVLPIVAVVGVVVVVGAAIYASQQSQYHRTPYGRDERYVTPVQRLGPCVDCDGDVNEHNGCALPCGHTVHYICMQHRRQILGEFFNQNRACSICSRTQVHGRLNGLTHRSPQYKKCAQCQQFITDDLYKTLEGENGSVHNRCWDQMQDSYVPDRTRPASTQGLRQQNNSSTNRSDEHEKCAHCQKPITYDSFKKMKCEVHSVHNDCWDDMEKSGFMTCASCFEALFE